MVINNVLANNSSHERKGLVLIVGQIESRIAEGSFFRT